METSPPPPETDLCLRIIKRHDVVMCTMLLHFRQWGGLRFNGKGTGMHHKFSQPEFKAKFTKNEYGFMQYGHNEHAFIYDHVSDSFIWIDVNGGGIDDDEQFVLTFALGLPPIIEAVVQDCLGQTPIFRESTMPARVLASLEQAGAISGQIRMPRKWLA